MIPMPTRFSSVGRAAACRLPQVLAACFFALLLTFGSLQARAAEAFPTLNTDAFVRLLQANHGKVVVVNFFATWCPPCREELPGLVALRARYPLDKVAFIGISLDYTQKDLQKYAETLPFNYPVYYAEPDLGPRLGIYALPRNVVYARDGKLALDADGFVPEKDLDELLKKLTS